MSEKEKRILEAARAAAAGVSLHTEPISPSLAADVLRVLPPSEGFDPEKIARQIERLPKETSDRVQVGKSPSQAFVAASVPGTAADAFAWAQELMSATSASSVKMNFGPGKRTDVKVFWGKPEVNTLIEIGGED